MYICSKIRQTLSLQNEFHKAIKAIKMGKAFYDKDFKLGILGGGQLGRMFIQEAINLDVKVSILDPDANAPCSTLSAEFEQGSLHDFDTVYAFGKDKDILTIEIEHVNVDALEKLESEGVKVYPQPHILRTVQDKGLQKAFYEKNDIATAPFYIVENKAGIDAYINELPFMQKLRTGGYDGKGVTALKTQADIDNAFDAPSILEKFVDFEKEIAVIIARNPSGEVKCFPVVELDFNPEANLVEFLFSPAMIENDIAKKAYDLAEEVAKAFKFVGILAVEMFVTKSGDVLVNEIAPRPHNSGHQTIEGNITSQYMQHLRAILDLPLGATDATQCAVMLNLLGAKGHEGPVVYNNLNEVLAIEGAHVHIYGKSTTKSFRKMGHVTVTGDDLSIAREKAQLIKDKLSITAK